MAEKMMDWNTPIEEAPVLPEKNASGERIVYDFEITHFKKNPKQTFSKNNNPYDALSVTIQLALKAEVDGHEVSGAAEDMLILAVKSQFRIFQYFTAIGVRKKGSGNFDPVKAKAWDMATNVGMTGKCLIKIDEFNGQKRVKIDRYLEPEDGEIDV